MKMKAFKFSEQDDQLIRDIAKKRGWTQVQVLRKALKAFAERKSTWK